MAIKWLAPPLHGRQSSLSPGRIQSIDSLFHYAPSKGYLTYARTEFVPLYVDDVLAGMTLAQRSIATDTCGNDIMCTFDYAVTGGK